MRAVSTILALCLILALAGCGGSGGNQRTTAPNKHVSPPSKPAATGPLVAVVLDSAGRLAAKLGGDGTIAAATPDGRHGWFIAGSFSHLDGLSETRLAHILPDGAVDPRWHGTLTSSGRSALTAAGNTVYAAGSIGDTDRSQLLALDASTGARKRSLHSPPGPITSLAVYGTLLIVATSTSTVRAQPSCLEAIDTGSGRRQSTFAADIRPAPEQGCIVAARLAGTSLYLAGTFRSVDGVPRPGVAKLEASSGRLVAAWKPTPAAIAGSIYDISPGSGAVVLAGSSPSLTALSTRTGAPHQGWRAPSAIRNPLSLAVVGDALLVAGDFRGGVARLRLANGSELTSWHAAPGQSGGPVVASGSSALVGIHRS